MLEGARWAASAQDLPAFAFKGSPSATLLTPPVASTRSQDPYFNDAGTQAAQMKERRTEIRERLLDALGLSQFVPGGDFMTMGYAAHWGLSLREDRSLAVRVRINW